MGIPSYFRHLCQTYPQVIQPWENQQVHNLYLDSNSIIYDSMRLIEYNGNDNDFEERLIQKICETIDDYLCEIRPTQTVYICFDGVAPVAKLDQQRDRRFKSSFMNHVAKQLGDDTQVWNQTAITPGTAFMEKLNHRIHAYYSRVDLPVLLGIPTKQIMVSGSDIAGEGEHKIFAYIRETKDKHIRETTVIYGLDADLIVLSLNHLSYGNILLYRETPAFVQNFSDLEPNASYVLHIKKLSLAILSEMTGMTGESSAMARLRMYDYILLTFLLGNDFLPHFPGVCLRTRGMDILMGVYRELFGRGCSMNTRTLCVERNGLRIHWPTFRKFIEALAKREHQDWLDEYAIRAKWERMPVKMDTVNKEGVPIRVVVKDGMEQDQIKDAGMAQLLNLPVKQRELEYYIRPEMAGWRKRYYENAVGIRKHDIKACCMNYLSGIEWVLKYYSQGCPDWRWSYHYAYPPLFEDLRVYTPGFEQEMIVYKKPDPVLPIVQLMYVLPKSSHALLPEEYQAKLRVHPYRTWYPEEVEFVWAFCRYFWECHALLPKIDIKMLEQLV